MSLKNQFDAAKLHIQRKEYRQARAILSEIDHPKADEWLTRIADNEDREYNILLVRRQKRMVIAIIAFLAVIAILFFAWYSFDIVPTASTREAQINLTILAP